MKTFTSDQYRNCRKRASSPRPCGGYNTNRAPAPLTTNGRLYSQHCSDAVPIDADIGNRTDRRPAIQLVDRRLTVTSLVETINGQSPVRGMDEPHFQDSGPLVDREFANLVVPGSSGRENFRDPLGSAAHTPSVEFVNVMHDEE